MASNQDEGRRQAMLEKQRKDMMDDIARQKEALQQVRNRVIRGADEGRHFNEILFKYRKPSEGAKPLLPDSPREPRAWTSSSRSRPSVS